MSIIPNLLTQSETERKNINFTISKGESLIIFSKSFQKELNQPNKLSKSSLDVQNDFNLNKEPVRKHQNNNENVIGNEKQILEEKTREEFRKANNSRKKLILFSVICLVSFLLILQSSEAENTLINSASQVNICPYYQSLFNHETCKKNSNVCEKFNGYETINDRLRLLVDEYRWVLHDKGNSLKFSSISAISDCKYFITLSNEGLHFWNQLSNDPLKIIIQDSFFQNQIFDVVGLKQKPPQIVDYLISYNEKFMIFWTDTGKLYKFDFKTKDISNFEVPNSQKGEFEEILISNDDCYMVTKASGHNSITVYNTSASHILQKFDFIDGIIKMIEFYGEKNDLIVADESSVKVYFLETSNFAYIFHSQVEMKRYYKNWPKLKEFSKFLK